MLTTPEHRAAALEGKRMAALYKITDPLWKAIANGHNQEVANLQSQLGELLRKDAKRIEEDHHASCSLCGR